MTAHIDDRVSRTDLIGPVLVRYALVVPILLLLFVPAGTFRWWEAWAYLGVLLAGSVAMAGWLFLRDPELLERRMRMREKERTQKWVIALSPIYVIGLFVLAGLDRRLGWSAVPAPVVLAADAVVVASFGLCVAVLRVNRWTSRIVEVEAGQSVITSGPYSVVRHPWYAAAVAMYLVTPLALGSWWALATTPLLLLGFVVRITDEETLLVRELPGYDAYRERVPWRLVPRVW